ncbi:MAG: hypothetical protein J6X11_10745 [Treponema sp.]|nr:hypothetical protein [Treponema sp.]MBR4385876.1 hypothetical protein [Treponema sp.]
MAIHPIDLSVVYTQMDNVAKFNASQNQVAQAINQSALDKGAIDNLEKSKTVQEAAKNESTSTKIKKDGGSGGGSGAYQGNGKKRRSSDDGKEKNDGQQEISDPRLGLHVDITG